ncbi:hypothetical protein RRG08_047219 [Elysia crispata]|uniref:Uncharacterized protein n=1 Tax=Elysia crispata TaxID=231223 RepID=A0AAE1ED26_9GAST|nr:hypothetical protein RRG08_047219 [Elysia crispata]
MSCLCISPGMDRDEVPPGMACRADLPPEVPKMPFGSFNNLRDRVLQPSKDAAQMAKDSVHRARHSGPGLGLADEFSAERSPRSGSKDLRSLATLHRHDGDNKAVRRSNRQGMVLYTHTDTSSF